MKRLCGLALVGCIMAGGVMAGGMEYLGEFAGYVSRFNKTYETGQEYDKAFSAFVHNSQEAELLNRKAESAGSEVRFSVSELSDSYMTERIISFPPLMENHETWARYDVYPKVTPSQGTVFTWQGSSKVTPVKNQGQCGSCYIFAAAASAESLVGNGESLSEQQVLDCIADLGKCNGGWPHQVLNAMSYGYSRRGWEYETAYPAYAAQVQTCRYSSVAPMYKYTLDANYYNTISTSTLIYLIRNQGVISVAVAVNNAFYQYSSGILTQTLCPNTAVNHAVAAVGYGTDSLGRYYFIIKNSWGPSWGQLGYAYVYTDACNIRYYAAYLG